MERDVSSNEEYLEFMQHGDYLHGKTIPFSWVEALGRWNTKLEATHIILDSKVLIIQGTSDTVVEWQYNTRQLQRLFAEVDLRFIDGARHELFQESEDIRDEVYGIIIEMLGSPDYR